jgi:hypothetical protein
MRAAVSSWATSPGPIRARELACESAEEGSQSRCFQLPDGRAGHAHDEVLEVDLRLEVLYQRPQLLEHTPRLVRTGEREKAREGLPGRGEGVMMARCMTLPTIREPAVYQLRVVLRGVSPLILAPPRRRVPAGCEQNRRGRRSASPACSNKAPHWLPFASPE